MSDKKQLVAGGVGGERRIFGSAMRGLLLVMPMLLVQAPAAQAQVSVGIGIEVPGVSIGINLPAYPDLQRVPGYPVYYAPHAPSNYFYHDGIYWVLQGDQWYASSGYNGPWQRVIPVYVPTYVLRVPVRYYRQPPPYFRPWRADAPPRWDQHWGRKWQERRPGWDDRGRYAAPPPAPLPTYPRGYPHGRYPQEAARQPANRAEHPAPHAQGRPFHQTEARPAPPGHRPHAPPSPRHNERPPTAQMPSHPRAQAAQADRSRPQGRAEPSKPQAYRRGDDSSSARPLQHRQARPVQQTQQWPASARGPG